MKTKKTNAKKSVNYASACNISRSKPNGKPYFTPTKFGESRQRNIGLGR